MTNMSITLDKKWIDDSGNEQRVYIIDYRIGWKAIMVVPTEPWRCHKH